MLTWFANVVAKRIDIEKLANLVEAKLARRLDRRLNSKLRKYMIVPLRHKRPESSESSEEKPHKT